MQQSHVRQSCLLPPSNECLKFAFYIFAIRFGKFSSLDIKDENAWKKQHMDWKRVFVSIATRWWMDKDLSHVCEAFITANANRILIFKRNRRRLRIQHIYTNRLGWFQCYIIMKTALTLKAFMEKRRTRNRTRSFRVTFELLKRLLGASWSFHSKVTGEVKFLKVVTGAIT